MSTNNLNINITPDGRLTIDGFKSPWNMRELWCSPGCDVNFVKRILKDNINTIIEFGSYDGGDGIKYKYYFPNADVYSIEPSPTCYEKIKPLEIYGLKVFNNAISDKDSIQDFYETYDHNANNYAPCGSLTKKFIDTTQPKIPLEILKPIKIETKRLDTFCNEQKINQIDFLHVDVEGHAIEVLNGLGNMKPRMIYIEVFGDTHNHSEDVKKILNENYVKVGSRGCDEFWALKPGH